MSQHSASPPPSEPTALCTAYGPLLPLLHTDGLPPDEAGVVGEHLASCAWCRARLADYDALYAALQRHFDPDSMGSTPIPTVDEIAVRSARPQPPTLAQIAVWQWSASRPHSRLSLALGTIAAVLLVALFGTLLVRQWGFVGASSTLDPQAKAYVAVLRAYYPPLLNDLGIERLRCITAYDSAPEADKGQHLSDCKPVEMAVVSASQALLAHLRSTAPPARWQVADTQLKAWAQRLVSVYKDRIRAIDQNDTAWFSQLVDTEIDPVSGQSCGPIQQINAELPDADQFPVSVSGSC